MYKHSIPITVIGCLWIVSSRIARQNSFASSTITLAHLSAGDTIRAQNPALAGMVRAL